MKIWRKTRNSVEKSSIFTKFRLIFTKFCLQPGSSISREAAMIWRASLTSSARTCHGGRSKKQRNNMRTLCFLLGLGSFQSTCVLHQRNNDKLFYVQNVTFRLNWRKRSKLRFKNSSCENNLTTKWWQYLWIIMSWFVFWAVTIDWIILDSWMRLMYYLNFLNISLWDRNIVFDWICIFKFWKWSWM